MSIRNLIREDLREFKAYSSARIEAADLDSNLIFLDANESALEAPISGASGKNWNRYPDPQPQNLRASFGRYFGVKSDQILVTRGSDEAIEILMKLFCQPGKSHALTLRPSFGYYAVAAKVQGVKLIEQDFESDFSVNWDLFYEKVESNKVSLIFVCNPNNPSGTLITAEEILQFNNKIKDQAILVIDEAYMDFESRETVLQHIDEYPNLVILRTLSKAFAMAGLRIGCSISGSEIIQAMQSILAPYPIPKPCIEAASEALSPAALSVYKSQWESIVQERARVCKKLANLPEVVKIYSSHTNFLLVEFIDPRKTFQLLLRSGLLVRDRTSQVRNCLRITIGTAEQNDLLLKSMGVQLNSLINREGRSIRKTSETQIIASVNLDKGNRSRIKTGIEYMDHMLEQVARHGNIDLEIVCDGDLQVDDHHSVEDCALALGQALKMALGERRGIQRYSFVLPMDESLCQMAIDLSGRPAFVLDGDFGSGYLGKLNLEMVPHFYQSLAQALGCALHISIRGENSHHKVESSFKALGKCLRESCAVEGNQIPSSKGVL
tara:strand:+ start:3514 stop:5166 length:1653 start_codon:yes stop_codon:yes gene_type:complete